jgi:hypothetical protein
MVKCDYCGNQIKWVEVTIETPAGIEKKNVALDLNEAVYHFDGQNYIRSLANVNHFGVCPYRKKWKAKAMDREKAIESKEKAPPWWID